jgi:hypothetical protein
MAITENPGGFKGAARRNARLHLDANLNSSRRP